MKIVGNKGQTRSCLGQTRLYIGCKGSSSRASVVISSREGRVVAAYHPSNLDFYFGFSTKYHDREVGLIAYQLRSYSPRLGRWLNRDPIEEEGGGNLYQFNLNSPLVSFDTLGEKPISQCKLNGIPISFVFNGVTLTRNGFSTPAVSGRPVKTKRTSWVSTIKILGSPALGGIDSEYTSDYSASRQKLRNEGPLPVGAYWIDVDEKRSAGTSKYSHIILYKAWGSYSWSLHPEAGTQTHGRSGFFIHGGLNWGSAGCIDIKSGDVKFNDFLKGLCKCYIPIIVKYELQQDKKTEREITWHYNLAPYNVPYVR